MLRRLIGEDIVLTWALLAKGFEVAGVEPALAGPREDVVQSPARFSVLYDAGNSRPIRPAAICRRRLTTTSKP